MTFNAGAGYNTLVVNAGSFTFTANPATNDGNLTLNDNAAVVFTAPADGGGYTARYLYALNLGANATLTAQSATSQAATPNTDKTVLVTSELSIATSATLDIGANAMIVHNGDLTALDTLLLSGLNPAGGGGWNGPGIDSTAAHADTTHLTAIGAISNNLSGGTFDTTFDGQPAVMTDVLVKFTYVGDATLDGKVDATDYSRIDSGTLTQATGWFNGDFNYDGVVNGSDYTLADNTFNTQGTVIPKGKNTSEIASPKAKAVSTTNPSATTASLFSNSLIASTADEIFDASSLKHDGSDASVLAAR